MLITASMSIKEAAEHAAQGLLNRLDLPETMCRVAIEIPPPPKPVNIDYNFRTNPEAAVVNRINLIKLIRLAQSEHTNQQKSLSPEKQSPYMDLVATKKFVNAYLANPNTPLTPPTKPVIPSTSQAIQLGPPAPKTDNIEAQLNNESLVPLPNH